MKQMTLIEMDGFLKGKCIPRDLKVNETNAEYLVRKFAELEAKCAALAAENAALKGALNKIAFTYSLSPHIHEMTTITSPATDAFLAEVRVSAIRDEATERDLFEERVMEKIFISKTTLEGLRTDDDYRNSTLSGRDYNGMWSQWKAIRSAQLRKGASQ
ncbi:hypothetical protein F2M41_22430 [Escherichia coli]|nr:hypothetical protein [Escherichia coli]